jgi:hypothetical protein
VFTIPWKRVHVAVESVFTIPWKPRSRWRGIRRQDPARYPYYSAFIEGALYAGYYAAIEHNLPLDMNAQADYEQLASLTWADVVVSNEQRFFASAFKTIWAPRGKRMVTASEFARLMRALA